MTKLPKQAQRRFFPTPPGFVTNGMSVDSTVRYLAIRCYKDKPLIQGRDRIWTNQTIILDLLSGKRISGTQNPPTGLACAVALSADGAAFVTKEYGDFKKRQGLLIWWDAATGKALRRVVVPGYEQEVVFSQGASVFLMAQKGRLELADPRTGKLLETFFLPTKIAGAPAGTQAHQLALSPNGQWIAARVRLRKYTGHYAEAGAGIVLWKRGEKAPRWAYPVREHGTGNTIVVANEGTVLATLEKLVQDQRLASDSESRGVICLDAKTGKERWFIPEGKSRNGLAAALAIDPARGRLAIRYWDRQIDLRRLTDGSLITAINTGKKMSNSGYFVERVRFSKDGKTLYDRQVARIALWDVEGLV